MHGFPIAGDWLAELIESLFDLFFGLAALIVDETQLGQQKEQLSLARLDDPGCHRQRHGVQSVDDRIGVETPDTVLFQNFAYLVHIEQIFYGLFLLF